MINNRENTAVNNITLRIIQYLHRSKRFTIYLVISRKTPQNLPQFSTKSIPKTVFLYSQATIFSTIILLLELINKHHIQIIQTQTLRGDYIILLSKFLRLISSPEKTFHISVKHNFLFGRDYKTRIVKNIAYLFSFVFVNKTICVGRNLKQRLSSYPFIQLDKISVILNGIKMARRTYRTTKKNMIIYASSLINRKNPIILLKALKEIHAPYHCDIYGNGPLKQAMLTYLARNGMKQEVILHGFSNTIDIALQKASIYVLPSQEEICSLGLLEAMNQGLCCIVSDIPGNTEIISHHRNGLVFKQGDAKSLTNIISYALIHQKEIRKLGQEARNTIRMRYQEKLMLSAYSRTYVQIAQALD